MAFDPSTLTALALSFLVAVCLVLIVFAWRWLKVWSQSATLSQESDALTQVGFYASIFVAAAEQMLADKAGPDKLTWVLDQIHTQLPDLDPDLVRAFVEAAVLRTGAKPAAARVASAWPKNVPTNPNVTTTTTGAVARSHTTKRGAQDSQMG